jgi:transposase-like protein
MRELPTSSKYWTEAEGRAVVAAWRRSGHPAAEFARRHGLQTKRLKYWSERLSRAERETDGNMLSLVPATIVTSEVMAMIRVGDVTIELASATAEQVAAIAHALARQPS